MEEKKLLEVGDVLYFEDKWRGIIRYKVTKVTAKQAILNENEGDKVEREIRKSITYTQEKIDLYVKCIGNKNIWRYLETPEWISKWDLMYSRRLVEKYLQDAVVKSSKLSMKECTNIINILKPIILNLNIKIN